MEFASVLDDLRRQPGRDDPIVHLHTEPPRPARHASPAKSLGRAARTALASRSIERLYAHQAKSLDLYREGRDLLVTTSAASGKSLCYQIPLIEELAADATASALLLFPTKALARDQERALSGMLRAAGIRGAAVLDGDTPRSARGRIVDRARVLLTNPDFLHAAILPHHSRYRRLLGGLRLLVLDELHVYGGILGANSAHLLRRLFRVCSHYGAGPRVVACSATVGNPEQLARLVTGRDLEPVDADGSPRGRRTYVLWNPPRVRATVRRSRRSANVEASELLAALVGRGVRSIVFSKAHITAELIYRFAREALGPGLDRRVATYRGGLLPNERRETEGRLFSGELLGVSTTSALELGVDVGGLDACVVVGWPGKRTAFFQQAGRAGRGGREALVVLVGLDTATNQFLLRHPEHIFGRPVEDTLFDDENPFVLAGQLRCAAHELPIGVEEVPVFGPAAGVVLDALSGSGKLRRIRDRYHHAVSEFPQHEVSLRDATDRNVLVQDAATGRVIAEVTKFDAPAIVHPGAVYLHQGETWLLSSLDLERSLAIAHRKDVDYYTQSHGPDDVHHVDHVLRDKPCGSGSACYGEVTAHYRVEWYERIRFYSLDAVSRHDLDLPTFPIESTALWIVPDEALVREALREGLNAAGGLSGIGFALRTLLPLFVTCDTLDLSHSVGSVNTPWQAIFVYEHYPRGLGFTAKGYDILDRLLPAALDLVEECDCRDGCPLCVGKPLRPRAVLNPERGEGSIPSRRAALHILRGLVGDGSRLTEPDRDALTAGTLTENPEAARLRLARALRRHLEKRREPEVLRPAPEGTPGWPAPESLITRAIPDGAIRQARGRREAARKLRRIAAGRRP